MARDFRYENFLETDNNNGIKYWGTLQDYCAAYL